MSAPLSKIGGSGATQANSRTVSFASYDSFKTSKTGLSWPLGSYDGNDDSASDNDTLSATSVASLSLHEPEAEVYFEERIEVMLDTHDNVCLRFEHPSDSARDSTIHFPRSTLVKHSMCFHATLQWQRQQGRSPELRFLSGERLPMEVFLLWACHGRLFNMTIITENAIYNHGFRYHSFDDTKAAVLPFAGASLIVLWCFAADIKANEFQNAIMRKFVQEFDKAEIISSTFTLPFIVYRDADRSNARSANKIFQELMAYKAWFLLKDRCYESFVTLYRMVGTQAFGKANDFLNAYYREKKHSMDAGWKVACLMDHV